MNIRPLSCSLLLATLLLPTPLAAAPSARSIPGKVKAPTAAFGSLEGIIFKDCRYTVVTTKAMFSHAPYEELENYSYTVRLRFHRDSKRVDVNITHPDGEWEGWGRYESGGDYTTPTARSGEYEQEAYSKAKLHYVTTTEDSMDGLELHVQSVGPVTRNAQGKPTCTIKLVASTFTEVVGNGAKIFSYEFADAAVIEGTDKKMGK